METRFKLLSSLEKVFFDLPAQWPELTSGTMLKNEIFSFQLAGWAEGYKSAKVPCKLVVESPLADYITVKKVDYVPVTTPVIHCKCDDDFITKMPGLFLHPGDPGCRAASAGHLQHRLVPW